VTAPTTVGDPDAMRAFARELMSRADLLRTAEQGPASRLQRAIFEGPAASRLRSTADDLTTRISGICSDIEATAQSLLADAATVEQQNADLRAAAEQQAAQQAKADAPAKGAPAPDAAPGDAPPPPPADAAPAVPEKTTPAA